MPFENLSKQVEAYATYIITAGITAIVAVGGTLGIQAIKHHLNPGPITQNEFNVDMLNNGRQARTAELQAELDQLNAEEEQFKQVVRNNDGNPDELPAANAEISEGQAPALTEAFNALRTFREQKAARITELTEQIAGYRNLETFLGTAGNPAALEDAIRHATRVAPAQAAAEGEGGSQ